MSTEQLKPDFIESFESRPAPEREERQAVAEEFNQFFDYLMLEHMEHIRRDVFSKTGQPFEAAAAVLRELRVADREFELFILEATLTPSDDERASEDEKRVIGLILPEGGGWSYRLGRDDVLRRFDLSTDASELRKASYPDWEMRHERDEKTYEKWVAQETLNNRFAEDLGVNRQPVTLRELMGLEQFLAEGSFDADL